MKIICVDDEAIVLKLTVSMCEKLEPKPEVYGFKGAKDALLWLKDHTADIALLDIKMPGMDGLELAARVKELKPDMPNMESYSVFYTAQNCTRPRPKALVIKSICDYANTEKSDQYQKFAAYTSINVFK